MGADESELAGGGGARLENDSCRVFISYSHKDVKIVKELVAALREKGLKPMWDRSFSGGTGFHEQIKTYIAHAHVFMPVITKGSSKRGWVHQEIGYASALNIPVMPVSIGLAPKGIIGMIQALRLKPKKGNFGEWINPVHFDELVDRVTGERPPLYECAADNRERARMLADYADKVARMGEWGMVRQKGGLSSFHIPDVWHGDPAWAGRYDDKRQAEESYCRCLREEHQALKRHAVKKGCRLVVDIKFTCKQYGKPVQKCRLESLLAFLESMDDTCQIATYEAPDPKSTTLVGDWFFAQSVSAKIGEGYKQTIFTRHAPTVRAQKKDFDEEFESLLRANKWKPEESRKNMIELLKDTIKRLG